MSQDLWTIRKGNTRISWVWNMRNDHNEVRKKARKHGKWDMKQDSAAWKFRTQKSYGNIYSEFENKFRVVPEVHFIHTISFWSLGSQESNASNSVQIKTEMKKLWSFENNWTKLQGHFKVDFEMTLQLGAVVFKWT